MFYYRLDVKFRCTYSEWVSKNSQTTNKGTWTSVRPMAVSNAHLWCARVGSWCRWACWRSSPPFRPICCWVTLTSLLTLLCCSVRRCHQYPSPGDGDAQRMKRAHRFYCVLFITSARGKGSQSSKWMASSHGRCLLGWQPRRAGCDCRWVQQPPAQRFGRTIIAVYLQGASSEYTTIIDWNSRVKCYTPALNSSFLLILLIA